MTDDLDTQAASVLRLLQEHGLRPCRPDGPGGEDVEIIGTDGHGLVICCKAEDES